MNFVSSSDKLHKERTINGTKMSDAVISKNEKSMHDIPLPEAAGRSIDKQDAIAEQLKAKSSSLKRFFKMSQKQKADYAESNSRPPQSPNEEIQQGEDEDEDHGQGQSKEQIQHRRFPLRLGGLQRHTTGNLNRAVKSETNHINKVSSKSTLKNSLSSYWGLMFKKGKKEKNPPLPKEETTISTTDLEVEIHESKRADVEKIAELVLNEEVHALKLSEDITET
uniref:Uncharacterized protein n=1 Tax=Glossina brevipalpis TaxID=37001 RepID=A0A1A9X1K2_9MUSC